MRRDCAYLCRGRPEALLSRDLHANPLFHPGSPRSSLRGLGAVRVYSIYRQRGLAWLGWLGGAPDTLRNRSARLVQFILRGTSLVKGQIKLSERAQIRGPRPDVPRVLQKALLQGRQACQSSFSAWESSWLSTTPCWCTCIFETSTVACLAGRKRPGSWYTS